MSNSRNIRHQFLPGVLLGLILAPTIFIWLVLGSFFFGYYPVVSHGNSMEPALRDGDAIWVKQLDIAKVNVGDIVSLPYAGEGLITHRVVHMESLSQGSYIVVTKGDANQFAELWEIGTDATVAVTFARARYAGYTLEFLSGIPARTLLIGAAVATVIAMWVQRKGMKPIKGKAI